MRRKAEQIRKSQCCGKWLHMHAWAKFEEYVYFQKKLGHFDNKNNNICFLAPLHTFVLIRSYVDCISLDTLFMFKEEIFDLDVHKIDSSSKSTALVYLSHASIEDGGNFRRYFS